MATRFLHRNQRDILEILKACHDLPQCVRSAAASRSVKMHLQYSLLLQAAKMQQQQQRKKEEETKQQQLEEIEVDRNAVPQNSNIIRNSQAIRRVSGYGSHGFDPITPAPIADNVALQAALSTGTTWSNSVTPTPTLGINQATLQTNGGHILGRSSGVAVGAESGGANNPSNAVYTGPPILLWADMAGHKMQNKDIISHSLQMIHKKLDDARSLSNNLTSPPSSNNIMQQIENLKALEANARVDGNTERANHFKQKRLLRKTSILIRCRSSIEYNLKLDIWFAIFLNFYERLTRM
jgi:hypothetical protein